MKKQLLYLLLSSVLIMGSAYPQLKEFSITAMDAPTKFPPIMRSHPDDGVVIIYSSIQNLIFDSNTLGVDDVKNEEDKYYVFLKSETQIITVKKRGYIEGKLPLMTLGAKEVKYFKIEDKEKTSEQIPVNIISNPKDAMISIDGEFKGIVTSQLVAGGVHKIHLEKKGYEMLDTSVEITTQNTLFTFQLKEIKPVLVKIKSVPSGARILLDGVEQGETDDALFLYPGVY